MVAIAAGYSHGLALKSNGSVVAWGSNSQGQTNVPSNATNIVAIAAGQTHSLALRQNGRVTAWGYNFFGQTTVPAGLTNVVAIAAGHNFSLALKSDGTVVGWGDNYDGQTTMPAGAAPITAIAGGEGHTLAIKLAAPRLTVQLSQENEVSLTLHGIQRWNWELQASANLIQWSSITNVGGSNATAKIVIPRNNEVSSQFFRLLSQ